MSLRVIEVEDKSSTEQGVAIRSGPELCLDGEGNMNKCDMRVLVQLLGVRDLSHVHTLHDMRSHRQSSWGRPRPQSQHVCFRAVGQANST